VTDGPHHDTTKAQLFGIINFDLESTRIIISKPLVFPSENFDGCLLIETGLKVVFFPNVIDLAVKQDTSLTAARALIRTRRENATRSSNAQFISFLNEDRTRR
jgi:hypothetical protein